MPPKMVLNSLHPSVNYIDIIKPSLLKLPEKVEDLDDEHLLSGSTATDQSYLSSN